MLSKLTGIVSVTDKVLYWFCANIPEKAGMNRRITIMQ
jgi:hypothetical protein